MKRIRINKDISIRWTILTNGESVSLVGRDLKLVLTDPIRRTTDMEFTVEGNTVTTLYKGTQHKCLGDYTLTLWENYGKDGQTAADACNAFTLVPTTCAEGGEDEGLDTGTVELSGDLNAVNGFVIPDAPKDDTIYGRKNGKWERTIGMTTGGGEIFNDYDNNIAEGSNAHAEGSKTTARGADSHAEGQGTTAENSSHAEGRNSHSKGYVSHAEGNATQANGNYSHAEGNATKSEGVYSHAEGNASKALGNASHAEGIATQAFGNASHAEGNTTVARNQYEHAQGSYNKSNTGDSTSKKTLHSIGFGTSDSNRKNLQEVMQNGDFYILGIGGYDGSNYEEAKTLQDVLAEYAAKIESIQPGDDYALESKMLILPVRSTTVTTNTDRTAFVATNDHIKIVDENMQCYTVKEWNDRSVANGFDNSLVAKPIGFRMQANDADVLFRWPFTGKTWNCLGTSSSDNAMQHSRYEYDQLTSAGSGEDYTCLQDANLGTNTAGSHRAAGWEITADGDSLTLYCGNTGQRWRMAKNCGYANFMAAFNYDERCDAIISQNEWMRHRFAICSGVKTTESDGTITSVEILNASGKQPAAGEDMYFYVDGVNTSLKAKYNINNRHARGAYYLTDIIAEYIYSKQVENGINMNDTGVNSADKPLLVKGAKGAEAIAVGGFWYIITPYISHCGTFTNYDYNIMDSPAVYYCKAVADGVRLPGDNELLQLWTNKKIIYGLMKFLSTYEGWTDDVPAYNSVYAWSCVRSDDFSAWYVYLGNGQCGQFGTTNTLSVWPVSAF